MVPTSKHQETWLNVIECLDKSPDHQSSPSCLLTGTPLCTLQIHVLFSAVYQKCEKDRRGAKTSEKDRKGQGPKRRCRVPKGTCRTHTHTHHTRTSWFVRMKSLGWINGVIVGDIEDSKGTSSHLVIIMIKSRMWPISCIGSLTCCSWFVDASDTVTASAW